MKNDSDLVSRLRQVLCLNTDDATDDVILTGTEGTFLRAAAEAHIAYEQLREEIYKLVVEKIKRQKSGGK